MSVDTQKNFSTRSWIRVVPPRLSIICRLKRYPENIDVSGRVRSNILLIGDAICTAISLDLFITSSKSSGDLAKMAPMKAPWDVPPTKSTVIPASKSALIAPRWARPLPPPRTKPTDKPVIRRHSRNISLLYLKNGDLARWCPTIQVLSSDQLSRASDTTISGFVEPSVSSSEVDASESSITTTSMRTCMDS